MRKKYKCLGIVMGLMVISVMIYGNQLYSAVQTKSLKPAGQVDSGDSVLRKMNRNLMTAKKCKKDGLTIISNIAKMVKMINLDVKNCTITMKELKEGGKGVPQTGGRMRGASLGFEYPTMRSCVRESMMIPGSTRSCDHFPRNAFKASGNAGRNLDCLKKIQSYLLKMRKSVADYCRSKKFQQRESRALKNHLLAQQTKANNMKGRFDQIIADIGRFIRNYKACKERLSRRGATPGSGRIKK